MRLLLSVPPEQISRIYFVLHVIEAGIVSVGDDGLALLLEGFEVVHHTAAEEGSAIVKGGFVDDDFGTFGLDAFHHALYAALPEIVGVALHREAVNTDDGRSQQR